MIDFLINHSSAIATLVAGSVAFITYKKNKSDQIESAARIVVLEIKESEKIVKSYLEMKNSDVDYPDKYTKILPLKSWDNFSHLFIKKLNNDEYEQLNNYFKECTTLERFIEKNHNFFWVSTEERARQTEIIGRMVAQKKPDSPADEFRLLNNKIRELYFSNTLSYVPAGIKNQIDKILTNISLISPTPTWNKLKMIAKYNDILG